ncbi:hypothetical protein M514_26186, partial [Trichuris suis]
DNVLAVYPDTTHQQAHPVFVHAAIFVDTDKHVSGGISNERCVAV